MENKIFEEEIDLMSLFYALFRKLWLIIAVAVVCATGMAAHTRFRVQPTYTSTATLLVLSKETTLTSLADLQLGSQLTKDYTVLITSRPVLDKVIENLDLKMNFKQLRSKISIVNPEDTRILSVSVTMNNAKLAKAVVDELSVVSSEFIGDMMEVGAPKLIEEGEIGGKTGPNITKNALLGFLAGALLVCVIVVVLELLNDTVQTEEDIEKYLGIPTLAIVPMKSSARKYEKNPKDKKRFKRGKAK